VLTRLLVIVAIAMTLSSAVAADRPMLADLVLLNGRIITVDPHDRVVQALAVRDGRIMAVGSNRAIERLSGPATRRIDLRGRTATPGLIDAHAHVLGAGLTALFELDSSNAKTIGDIVDQVARRASGAKPGEWILGAGWDETKLAEQRHPTASDLDAAAPNNPVWLYHTSGHYAVANSEALRLAGIGPATATPAAGVIERAPDGKPTGILKESAMDWVTAIVPAYSPEKRRQALLHMIEAAHSEGMTGWKDPDVPPAEWEAYRTVATDGQLTVNVCVLFHTPPTIEGASATLGQIRAAQSDLKALHEPTLGVCGAKIYMDGSAIAHTAWSYAEWQRSATEIDTGNRGFPALDPALYRQQVQMFVDAGVSVGTHAIGDRAIDWVVDSYAEALARTPTHGLRLAIIHANEPTEHALEVMARLEKQFDSGIPETQAEFLWWLGDAFPPAMGMTRIRRLMPLHSYLDRGVRWAGGSDVPVTPLAARYGLWASVAREPLTPRYGSEPFGRSESVDVHAALRSYTIWAARQLFMEQRTGSLETGKSADIAVWDRDPYSVEIAKLKDMKCELTLFGGRVVYDASRP